MTDEAWLEWRTHGIGASDIAGLMGLSRWQSPWSVWARKTGLMPASDPTPRQRVGTVLEAAIGQLFHEQTGLYVAGEQTWCTHQGFDWARCTVDGFVVESPSSGIDDAIAVFEVKTAGEFGWPDGLPIEYRAQVTWAMGVTGLRHAWVAVLHGGFNFATYELAWDDAVARDWALMRDAADRFWTDHVLTGIPPDVDGSEATREALIAAFPEHEAGVDVSLDHLAELLAERARLKELSSEADKRVKLIDNTIREAIGDATFGTLDGERVLKLQTINVGEYVVPARIDHRLVAATKSDRRRTAA